MRQKNMASVRETRQLVTQQLDLLFRECAEAIAIETSATSLCYADLALWVGGAQKLLIQSGVRRGDRVLMATPRCPECLAFILALWRLGAVYVPLDLNHPTERLNWIVNSCNPSLAVIDSQVGAPDLVDDLALLDLRDLQPQPAEPACVLFEDEAAYTIYTSGSTGKPKGVVISHGALANFLQAFSELLPLGAEHCFLAMTTFCFDISLMELLLPLWQGASLFLLDDKERGDFTMIGQLTGQGRISHIQATPSTWDGLLESGCLPERAVVAISGGEPLGDLLAGRLLSTCRELHNFYGPTETTIWSTAKRLSPSEAVNAGQPILETELLLLDGQLEEVAPGECGDLYIAGSGLAQGYHGRPDLTAAVFLPHPRGTGERIYRTGDLARFDASGEIVILGRADRQIKLRGHRIELGDIESHLQQLLGNVWVHCTVVELAGTAQLGAWFIGETTGDHDAILDRLADRVPGYMLPSFLLPLQRIPRNANGKLDKDALPLPLGAPTRKPLDSILAGDVPQNTLIGDCGLDSLSRMVLSTRLGQALEPQGLEGMTVATVRSLLNRNKVEGTAFDLSQRIALTKPQKAMLLAESVRNQQAYLVLGYTFDLGHGLSIARIETAWEAICRIHPAPRARLCDDGASLVFDVPARLTHASIVDAELFFEESVLPHFDATRALAQAFLHRQGDRYTLFLAIHHLVFDGWSAAILARDFRLLLAGQPLPTPEYGDGRLALAEGYRGETHGGEYEVKLPSKPSHRDGKGRTKREIVRFVDEDQSGIEACCHDLGISSHTLFLLAFRILLHRYGNEMPAIRGARAARNSTALLDRLGFFVQEHDICIEIDDETSFRDLALRLEQASLDDRRIYHAPAPASFPEACFTSQHFPVSDTLPFRCIPNAKPLCDLLVNDCEGYCLEWLFDDARFDEVQRSAICRHYVQLVKSILAEPESPVGRLPIMAQAEIEAMIALGSGPDMPLDDGKTVLDLIEEVVSRHPEQPAVVDGMRCWTYTQLWQESERVAQHLIKVLARPALPVVVYVEKSPEFLALVLGIMRAGAIYTPVDRAHPLEVVQRVIDNVRPGLVIGDCTLDAVECPVHLIAQVFSDESGQLPPLADMDTAYILHTSGSTGKPKGVPISHRNLKNFIYNDRREYSFSCEDRSVFFGSPSFDITISEIFSTVCFGATLYIPPLRMILDVDEVWKFCIEHAISVLFIAAPIVSRMLANLPPDTGKIKLIRTGGEQLKVGAIGQLPFRLVNAYGLTENTIYQTSFDVQNDYETVFPPVGRTIANARTVIVDPANQICPAYVEGQILLAGETIFSGYLLEGERNADCLIELDVMGVQQTFLCTGDYGYLDHRGNLVVAGRRDRQVKLRGRRIELRDIEARFTGLAHVHDAVVQVQGNPTTGCLVAHLHWQGPLPQDEARVADQLTAELAAHLPEYMVPQRFHFWNAFPLTNNGKVDLARLNDRAAVRVKVVEDQQPRGTTESALAEIWQSLLEIDGVGRHENFFELGGHSLLVSDLVQGIRNRFPQDLALIDFFRAQTIAEQARLLMGEVVNDADWCDDATLPDDVRPQPNHGPFWGKRILLTGASGFLGTYLLRELLADDTVQVIALVRGPDPEVHLRRALARFDVPLCDTSRLEVLACDLAQPNLGLANDSLAELAERIDVIINAAVVVACTLPYSSCKPVNVDAVLGLLRLASTGKPKTFHQISTVGLLDRDSYTDRCGVPEYEVLPPEGLENGYTRSKWVAEKLVMQAFSRGLSGSIIRLGRIGSAITWGKPNPADYGWLFMRGCAQLGAVPDWGESLEQMPGDWLAHAIHQLAKSNASDGKTLHLTGRPLSYERWVAVMRQQGIPLEMLNYDKWLDRLHEQPENPLAGLKEVFDEQRKGPRGPFQRRAEGLWDVLDTRTTRSLLEQKGLTLPEFTEQDLAIYLQRYLDQGFLGMPTS